jgi:hypothetical protein
MKNTYTYSVTSLKKADEVYFNILKSAVINVAGTDGTNQVNVEIEVRFNDVSQHPDAFFIEYSDLTEQDVLVWVANDPIMLNAPSVLDEKLIELSHDTVTSNFPWS